MLSKIEDYKVTDYVYKVDKMLDNLDQIIHGKDFTDEIIRFTPKNIQERTINKNNFFDYLVIEIRQQLLQAKKIVDK